MAPKKPPAVSGHDLFRLEPVKLIDLRRELMRLAELIDWPVFEHEFGRRFASISKSLVSNSPLFRDQDKPSRSDSAYQRRCKISRTEMGFSTVSHSSQLASSTRLYLTSKGLRVACARLMR